MKPKQTNKEKLISKDFIFAIVANVSTSMIFYLLMTTMALYAFDTYGVNASVAGMTSTVYVIGSLFGRLLTGRYIELFGRRRLAIIAACFQIVFSLCYLLPFGLSFIFVNRFFHGITFGISNTSIFTIATSYIPDSRKGEGIGYFGLGATFTMAIGPFIAVPLAEARQFDALFMISAGFGVVVLVFLLLMNIKSVQLTAAQRSSVLRGFSFSDFFEPRAISIAVIGLITSACYGGVTAYLTPYTEGLGLLKYVTGFYLVYAFVLLLTRPPSGRLLDKKGDSFVIIPALVFFAAAMAVLGAMRGPITLILAGILMSVGFGVVIMNGNAISIKRVEPHRVAMGSATFYVFADIGMGVAPIPFGRIVDTLGYSAMYYTEAIMLAAAIVIYWFIHGRKYRRK